MIIIKTAKTLTDHLLKERMAHKKIGFVPTMGALHEGHLSLISAATSNNDISVCSIFVNPTQFNNPNDFAHYPTTIEKDIELLTLASCTILFLPSVDEMYPSDYQKKHYALGSIENRLEGQFRPGHFQGVCQAVDRLLEIVSPDNLYMGQKDYQQCMVIRKLLALTHREQTTHLILCPTVREKNGLAMSSRNLRLTENEKELATSLYAELENIKKNLGAHSLDYLKQTAQKDLDEKGFQVDYVEIAHEEDLSSATTTEGRLVALIAAGINNVRLIDNLILK